MLQSGFLVFYLMVVELFKLYLTNKQNNWKNGSISVYMLWNLLLFDMIHVDESATDDFGKYDWHTIFFLGMVSQV